MSSKFPEIGGRLDLPALEQTTLQDWDSDQLLQKLAAARQNGPRFAFYEGPPTANGKPGLHHVFGRSLKDVICRYRSMSGANVLRRAGWDTHGLPVEIAVEKELGLTDRNSIEKYGIKEFNNACRDSVYTYKKSWDKLTKRIGYWVDLDNPYITCEAEYIESVWWLIAELYKKDLLYRGHKIQWYSPGSGTVLSSHEVSLGYREVADPGVFVSFSSKDEPDTAYLAWTTTPWTLPANAALAVRHDINYVKVKIEGWQQQLILAEARLSVLEQKYRVIENIPGEKLCGRSYQPLYPPEDQTSAPRGWRIVAADFVSTEDGTGIVHIAPPFGEDDYAIGQKEQLPFINHIDPNGKFTSECSQFAGAWFKDADKSILRDLKQRGCVYRVSQHLHNYPFDWRRGTPLMNYPVDSWFVRTTRIKDKLIAINKDINWHPPNIGSGRFGNWLEHNVDWSLSRKRFWGTPLPIWVSDQDPEQIEVIDSIQSLRKHCPHIDWPEQPDLHRPWVDGLSWQAADGSTMRRVPDVVDVWFDSGAMPFAQWHYPFENKQQFEQYFPADFIAEGVDQTRGWFYTLHVLATAIMDKPAYRNVLVNGLILDEKGEKMSKSKGNVLDPDKLLGQHGADVLRWYLIANSEPWENLRFNEQSLAEIRNRVFGTIENTYSFVASYANIDGYTGDRKDLGMQPSELDRWIISQLNSTVQQVEQSFACYSPHRAARSIESFIDDLSNWYIRRSRLRFWRAATDNDDKNAAYHTACTCLQYLAGMMAPIAPFFADWLHRNLRQALDLDNSLPHSIHLADFPKADEAQIDRPLQQRMALARKIVTAVLLLRNQQRINVRQPLARISLACSPKVNTEYIKDMQAVILEEVNVRQLELIADSSQIANRTIKPNFRKLGSKLGAKIKMLQTELQQLKPEQIELLATGNSISIELDGDKLELQHDEVEIILIAKEGWEVANTSGIIIALDTTINHELREQGIAREVINRIQNFRKQCNLQLTDRIKVQYHAPEEIMEAIAKHRNWIQKETLATELDPAMTIDGEYRTTATINEHKTDIAINKA
ncbi:MAG: isoleucine--tRNA ligase [Candidatus Porifericomitaceae bacterium WSBS_2022_MAG_OTU9]